MCDIRYFKAAYHNYEVAARLMPFYQSDELYLNDVAYNLQQCVEKTLKAFLECKGVTVPQTHSVSKLIAMSGSNGSAAVITDWILDNQYEIEMWESETQYNFDVCLEAERIRKGLDEVRIFLDANHLKKAIDEEVTDEIKEKLLKKMPGNIEIRDDFEWNCYYAIFQKRIG
ncbi:MAG: HEPN domain-containing protein [Lachnospiraceae bacterium]|nr:HEPN domain-containing protein [Lachnospiraceae bacterium]